MKEIKNRILYVLFAILLFRVGSILPIPLIDVSAIKAWFSQESFGSLSLINSLTGGSLENFSIFALSIGPYITASIIIQLLEVAIPKIKTYKEDTTPEKFNRTIKLITVGLSIIEAVGLVFTFRNQGLLQVNVFTIITTVITLTTGSMFLVWLGDRITEKGVGNGVSIILVAGIISKIPTDISKLYNRFIVNNKFWYVALISILLIVSLVILLVIILESAVKNIPVNSSKGIYARQNYQSTLPIKVNMSGVIPVIFTSSILSIPLIISGFTGSGDWIKFFNQNYWFDFKNIVYTLGFILYAGLIFGFAYFYSEITFNPREIADNLKKNGSTIPGIRPGQPTIEYLKKTTSKLIPIGAFWLLVIVSIPIICNGVFSANLSLAGTSLIIIVGVILETLNQINSLLVSRHYSGFLTKK